MESKTRVGIAHHIVAAVMGVIYEHVGVMDHVQPHLKKDLLQIVEVVLEDEGIK